MWKFLIGNKLGLLGIGLILTGIGSIWLYIAVLQKNLAQAQLGLVKAELVNVTNVTNIKRISDLLDEAIDINARTEEMAADITEQLKKELEKSNADTQEVVKEVKKTLSSEECSSIVIPSDTQQLLDTATSRANQDYRSTR